MPPEWEIENGATFNRIPSATLFMSISSGDFLYILHTTFSNARSAIIRFNHDSDSELFRACICALGHLTFAEILIFIPL